MVTELIQRLVARGPGCLLAAGLLFLPACSTPGGARGPSDHVFSTISPRDLDSQAQRHALPAKAEYPAVPTSGSRPTAEFPAQNRSQVHNLPTTSPTSPTSPASSATPGSEGVARVAAPWQRSADSETPRFARRSESGADSSQGDFILATARRVEAVGDRQELPDGRVRHAPEPRLTDAAVAGTPRNTPESGAPPAAAAAWPDEYVFDGGDRGAPVHYFGTQRRGLETEDTVIEYNDHDGDFQVRAANRVCVYAPRFGSVRTVTGQETDVKFDRAAGASDSRSVENLNAGDTPLQSVQGSNPLQLLDQRRPGGMDHSLPPQATARNDRPEQTRKVDHGHQGRAAIQANALDRIDAPLLAERLDNAVVWTRDQFPVISASTSSATEIIAKFRPQQTIGLEDQRKPGVIRIVKLADRRMAQSGDTVTFEIRFHNTGDFPVHNVRIVDNLTPRLAYVADSASIDGDHPGEVLVEPNGEGSDLLTFELDGPLEGGSTGTIRFEARVR